MAYKKAHLSDHEGYQRNFALLRAVEMLCTADDVEGVFQVGAEAPIEGWDDVVEVGTKSGARHAPLYQLKHQYGDFETKLLRDLFLRSKELLADETSSSLDCQGVEVAKHGVSLKLVMPSDSMSVTVSGEKLALKHLRTLCGDCNPGSAGVLENNKGANLQTGPKAWFDAVAAWFNNDYSAAARVLAQYEVVIQPETWVRDEFDRRLAELFCEPQGAKDHLTARILKLRPEEPWRADTLLAGMEQFGPKGVARRLTLRTDGGKYWVGGMVTSGSADAGTGLRELVRRAWDPHTPTACHVAFSVGKDGGMPPGLRRAAARLMIHATSHPVRATGVTDWLGHAWDRTGRTLGGTKTQDRALASERFQDGGAPWRPHPMNHLDAGAAATRLATEMDEHFWEAVAWSATHAEDLTCDALRDGVADALNQLRRLSPDYARFLRAWWADEGHIDASLRAGGAAADRVGRLVLGLAALRFMFGERLGEPGAGDTTSVAFLGSAAVRGLALEAVSRRDNNDDPGRALLHQCSTDILAEDGLVLVPKGAGLISAKAKPSSTLGQGEVPRIGTSTVAGVPMDIDELLAYCADGRDEALRWFEATVAERAFKPHDSALKAALAEWKEHDDAA